LRKGEAMAERTYSFTIDDDLHNLLKKIAKKERRTINNTVAIILEDYLRIEQKKGKPQRTGIS
jgi:predicted transcriptional regulator